MQNFENIIQKNWFVFFVNLVICSIGITKENVKNTKIYCTGIKKGTLIFSLPHEIGVDMDGYDTYFFFSEISFGYR